MSDDPKNEGQQPIPPAKRRILQEQFERGSKMMASGQYDYATEMFTNCVLGDPGNVIYVNNFLGNLQRKYNNNKKGGKMAGIKGAGTKGAIKKAMMKKDWMEVIKKGIEYLKLNPWDAGALSALADACGELDFGDCQIAYLKAALDANIKDAELNRKLARALDAQGDYDAAIICWRRVLQAKKEDEEAKKGISNASVRKTIKSAKYEEAETSTDVMVDKQAQDERRGGGLQLTEEQKLEKAIKKDPSDIASYIELADLHTRNEQYDEAEKVMTKALEASGGDLQVRERLEDARLRRLREKVSIAEKRAQEDNSAEAVDLYNQFRDELNNVELQLYADRSERYPNNLAYKYELAVRLQRAGKFREAIAALQEARRDPQRKGDVALALGECFQQIKQYKLAMTHYEEALGEIPERNTEARKRALYNAGRLALGLKEFDKAEEYLNTLAGIDYSYRDVPDLLDKIRVKREEEEEG